MVLVVDAAIILEDDKKMRNDISKSAKDEAAEHNTKRAHGKKFPKVFQRLLFTSRDGGLICCWKSPNLWSLIFYNIYLHFVHLLLIVMVLPISKRVVRSSSSDTEVSEQTITDNKIELIGDEMEDFNSDGEGENESSSLIKSDIYFMAHSSKSKLSKKSFAAVLENFDLYEADIKKIVDKEHKLFCKEFNIKSCSDKEMLKIYHLLKYIGYI